MNRDEKEVKQLRLSSLFTIVRTDVRHRNPPWWRFSCSKLSKKMKICQKQKQKCKKQLWNGKVAWQGQAGCSPSARPLLRSIKSDKMTFIALLYSPFSALQFAFYFTFLIFSSKTAFSCLLSDSRAQYLCNVQRGRCGNILQSVLLLDIVWATPYQDNSLHFIPFATLFPETSLSLSFFFLL